jgi:hypothetical protein
LRIIAEKLRGVLTPFAQKAIAAVQPQNQNLLTPWVLLSDPACFPGAKQKAP